jgi:hypothetical protein
MTSIKYGGMTLNSATVEATKFVGPYKPHMHQYIIELAHQGQMIGPQSTRARATTLRALNMKTDNSHPSHPVFSTFS